VQIAGARESGFEQSFVAQPRSAVLGDALAMQQFERLAIEPDRLVHFASARSVSRKFAHDLAASFHLAADFGIVGEKLYPADEDVAVSVSPFSTWRSESIFLGRVTPSQLPILDDFQREVDGRVLSL